MHFIWLHPSFFWIGDLKRTMISVRKEKQISFSCKFNFSQLAMTDKIIMLALLYFLHALLLFHSHPGETKLNKETRLPRENTWVWLRSTEIQHTYNDSRSGRCNNNNYCTTTVNVSLFLKVSNMGIPWWSHLVINLSKKNYNFFGQAIHYEPA